MSRPERLAVVTGTGTEVGKTWVAVALATWLRDQGCSVAARKPAQSFAPDDTETDADLLASATGEAAEAVCPPQRWYPIPLAPPMAADALGRPPIALADLLAELVWPEAAVDVGLVEGAGGLASPIAHDGDTAALIDRLGPDVVVVVTEPALGVVSNVRLAARALRGTGPVVVLNRYDPADDLHRRSRDWLRRVDGLAVVTDAAEAGRVLLTPTPIT